MYNLYLTEQKKDKTPKKIKIENLFFIKVTWFWIITKVPYVET